jgi:hypothetical protein
LKWLQTYSAGVEAYRWKEFLDSNVVLTNCRIVQGPNIADHAMSLLLAPTRGLNSFFADKAREDWDREDHQLLELQDMTAAVTGVGGSAPKSRNARTVPGRHRSGATDERSFTLEISERSDHTACGWEFARVPCAKNRVFKENIGHFVDKEPMRNVVDKQKGY